MRILLLILAFLVAPLVYAVPAQVNCARAEEEMMRVDTWGDAYRYFKRYKGQCTDGALAQGLSGAFTGILDKKWGSLHTLERLTRKDSTFLNWLLLSSFYDTEDESASCRIRSRLRNNCPKSSEWLCAKLDERVGESEEYMQSCEPNLSLDADASHRSARR
jgi:hypothetical protein